MKFGSFKVLSCQFRVICLSFLSICINRDVKYQFPLRTYNGNSSTSLALQDGQIFLIDRRSSQLSKFRLGQSVKLCNVSFCSKCFPIELVLCSDGWRWTWWQTINMIPVLHVFLIAQCGYNRYEDTCLESFQAIGHFVPTFNEAHQASKMMCKVRSLSSQIKPH